MSYFLRNAAGFFIQIYPCAYLCLLPFDEGSCRVRRKWVFIAYTALSLFFSLLFPSVAAITASEAIRGTYANIYMLGVMLLFIAGYFCIIREKPMKKLLVISLVIFYAATQYLTVNTINRGFVGSTFKEPYTPLGLLLFALTTVILFPLALRLVGRAVRDYLTEIDLGSMKKDYLWVLCVTGVYFVMMFTYTTLPTSDLQEFWIFTGPTFIFVAVVLTSFYYALFREAVRRKREETLRRHEEIQRVQARKIEGEIENARRMRHDMRHHLREIYQAVSQNRKEDALNYLTGVIEQTSSREAKRFCENQIVNGILQYYTDWAESEGIRCRVTANCSGALLDAADLTVVFGNVLENAIQACEAAAPDERFIAIDVGTAGSALILQVTNRCEGVRVLPDAPVQDGFLPAEAFVSARPDGGMGLKSVSLTAQRNAGVARFSYDEKKKVFISQIRMNFKPEA